MRASFIVGYNFNVKNESVREVRDEATRLHPETKGCFKKERADSTGERNALVEQFAEIDFDKIWDETTPSERRVLIEDFLENIYLYPDRLTVQVVGAPAIMVTLQEVGLHHVCRTIVSKGGLEPPRPYGH